MGGAECFSASEGGVTETVCCSRRCLQISAPCELEVDCNGARWSGFSAGSAVFTRLLSALVTRCVLSLSTGGCLSPGRRCLRPPLSGWRCLAARPASPTSPTGSCTWPTWATAGPSWASRNPTAAGQRSASPMTTTRRTQTSCKGFWENTRRRSGGRWSAMTACWVCCCPLGHLATSASNGAQRC